MQISAQVPVTKEIAASFPSRPDRVVEARNAAEDAMKQAAAERHRHVSTLPELTDISEHELMVGCVVLTFVADTESD